MTFSKTIAVAAMMMSAAVLGGAAMNDSRQIQIYSRYNNLVSPTVEAGSKDLARRMFAAINVEIVWHTGVPSHLAPGAIVIEMTTNTPDTLKPGALAYAFPYEGIHIRVLFDRVQKLGDNREVLAHVIVHEVTHILQGEPRHSEEGVMKALWSTEDLREMAFRPMKFAPEDVQLIDAGLKRRAGMQAARAAESAAVSVSAAVQESAAR